MTPQEQKVCEVCRERPATHHTSYGCAGRSSHLCVTCFEQIASPLELEAFRHSEQVVRNGKCRYCGAPAVGGTTGMSIPGIMEVQPNLWCEPCRLDLVEFGDRPENAIPKSDVRDKAKLGQLSQGLAERESKLQEFMRQKIRERSQI